MARKRFSDEAILDLLRCIELDLASGSDVKTVSKNLNHASDTGKAASVTGIYGQKEYLAEKRRALISCN